MNVRTNISHPMIGAISNEINHAIQELHLRLKQVNQASALIVQASSQVKHDSSKLLIAAQQPPSKVEETTLAALCMTESINKVLDMMAKSTGIVEQSWREKDLLCINP